MNNKIQIFHTTDDRQRKIVRVPISNTNSEATLYETDFNELMGLGLTCRWYRNSDGIVYVNTSKRCNLPIARLITDAFQESVMYLNGDKTDLRRDNLVLNGSNRRAAKFRARELVVRTPRLGKVDIEHVFKHGQTGTSAGGVMS